jgi:hypothetical protein
LGNAAQSVGFAERLAEAVELGFGGVAQSVGIDAFNVFGADRGQRGGFAALPFNNRVRVNYIL